MFRQWKSINRDGLNKIEKDLKLKSFEVTLLELSKLYNFFKSAKI